MHQIFALFCLFLGVEAASNGKSIIFALALKNWDIFLDPIFHTILDACIPRERVSDKEVFLTLQDVMKDKCLDHVTTLLGLDEQTIEEDFKAVDTDEDGKATLEEGMKVFEYLRKNFGSLGFCSYDCCLISNVEDCSELSYGPQPPNGDCEAKLRLKNMVCTFKGITVCKGACHTIPYSIESGEEKVPFVKAMAEG